MCIGHSKWDLTLTSLTAHGLVAIYALGQRKGERGRAGGVIHCAPE